MLIPSGACVVTLTMRPFSPAGAATSLIMPPIRNIVLLSGSASKSLHVCSASGCWFCFAIVGRAASLQRTFRLLKSRTEQPQQRRSSTPEKSTAEQTANEGGQVAGLKTCHQRLKPQKQRAQHVLRSSSCHKRDVCGLVFIFTPGVSLRCLGLTA